MLGMHRTEILRFHAAFTQKSMSQGAEEINTSVGESTNCSSRGLGFGSWHLHGGS